MNAALSRDTKTNLIARTQSRLLAAIALILSVVLMPAASTAAPATNIIYVNKAAPAGGGGTSWLDAYKYLQDALAAAADGASHPIS